jgi:hypothetical protein
MLGSGEGEQRGSLELASDELRGVRAVGFETMTDSPPRSVTWRGRQGWGKEGGKMQRQGVVRRPVIGIVLRKSGRRESGVSGQGGWGRGAGRSPKKKSLGRHRNHLQARMFWVQLRLPDNNSDHE